MLSMPLFPRPAIRFIILELVRIATAFQPNCTLPPEHTIFVSRPNARGTLTILWDCISILILCTWNIQHLNIPARRPYLDNTVTCGWLKKAWWAVLDSRRKFKWMILTILMPEYIMGKAINELLSARVGYKDLARLLQEGGQHPQKIHAYFANMGGYYLDFSHLLKSSHNGAYGEEQPRGMVEVTSANPGLVEAAQNDPDALEKLVRKVEDPNTPITRTDVINLSRLRGNRWALNLSQLCFAGSLASTEKASPVASPEATKKTNLFANLPYVNPQDLEKADRGDALVKLIAILQVFRLMAQLLVRTIRHLPISQLEIAVFAFSVSSLITYLILWDHPQGLDCRYAIRATRIPDEDEFRGIILHGPRFLWTWGHTEGRIDSNLKLAPIPNDASHQVGTDKMNGSSFEKWAFFNNGQVLSLVAGSILGGTVFGGLHCLAWNFQFPTPTETLLWRISSILMVALPVFSIPSNLMWSKYNVYYDTAHLRKRRFWGLVLVVFFLIPYLLARLFILFEIFRSLFYLPPKAFVSTLSRKLPY